MCNAFDYVVRVVLGQCVDKKSHVIYYASHTLNDAQLNYIVTEKEFLVVIFDLKSFDLILFNLLLFFFYAEHFVIKHLFPRKMINLGLQDGFCFCKISTVRLEIRKVLRI